MKKHTLLLLLLLFAGTQHILYAHHIGHRTISGTVISSDDGQGIPHAQIMVRFTAVGGTATDITLGTITDLHGRYTIEIPDNVTHLTFSFMGKVTQDVEIGGRTTIDVTLQTDALMLEEFVVTGYGVTRRSAFTGSAVTVSADDLRRQTEPNLINALQGMVPGMQISNSAAQPGSGSTILLRGIGSLQGNRDPLFVIDGVPITAGNISSFVAGGTMTTTSPMSSDPLAGLNPNDIESITVLKDAAATAIYGSRAANGVVVITTRRGREGPGQIDVNLRTGLVMRPQMSHRNRMLNLTDFETLMIDGEMARQEVVLGWDTPNRDAAIATLLNDGILRADGNEYDWFRELSRVGRIHDISISASGGTERRSYFLSLGYMRSEFYLHGSGFERFTARSNIDYRANNWFTIGLNLSGSYTDQDQTGTTASAANPLFNGRLMRPNEPFRNPDGTWNFNTSQGVGHNLVARFQDPDASEANTRGLNAMVTPFVRLNLYRNVFFQTRVSVEINQLNEREVFSATVDGDGIPMEGRTRLSNLNSNRQTIVNTANWLPSINGMHNFNLLVGQEAQRHTTQVLQAVQEGFLHFRLREIANNAGSRAGSTTNHSTLVSYFGNLQYELHNRYFLSASIRRDGSSRFGDEHLWGTFYSVGARWRLSEESFMQPTRGFINNLALRVSYGTAGNMPRALHGWAYTYSPVAYSVVGGTAPTLLGNPGLRWESKNKFNVGMEAMVFDRISLEVDYYHEIINNMLHSRQVSRATGFTSYLSNMASMQNTGVEIQVNAMLVNNRDFRWTVGANVSANRNKVLYIGTTPAGLPDTLRGTTQWSAAGMAWNSFFLREWAVCPQTGLSGWRQADGEFMFGSSAHHGSAPQVFVGTPYAQFWGGFNTRLFFRGFDFAANFIYSLGGYHYSSEAQFFEADGWRSQFSNVNYWYFDNRWTTPGQNAGAPRFIRGHGYSSEALSTRFLMRSDFLRLRNVTFGYTIPRDVTSRIGVTNARIYASLDNLFTWTHRDHRGWEPNPGLGEAHTVGQYGQPRNFIVGINFTF
ncbi:MAG: SusC/RagA family TonB-linked outer membrane protein [Bacteroidales bacterium]|nr:SusC/RagA family TonB-linked outer membrane protein [Bacteroidales bacterium]